MAFTNKFLINILTIIFISFTFIPSAIAQFGNNSLSQAVDNTSFNFTTESFPVFSQTNVSNFDGDSVQMANISDDGVTVMPVFVPNATTVTFDWKVSSEANYDFLALVVLTRSLGQTDIVRRTSGERNWETVSLNIPAGGHWLVWGYTKDGSGSFGQDTGWIDNIRIGDTGNERVNKPIRKIEPKNILPPIYSLLLDEDDSFTSEVDISNFSPFTPPLTSSGVHIKIESDAGHPIGQGRNLDYTGTDQNINAAVGDPYFLISRFTNRIFYNNSIDISIRTFTPSFQVLWNIGFYRKLSAPITVGKYTQTTGFPYPVTSNGLNIFGLGNVCSIQDFGEFTIYEVEYDGEDVTKLIADFKHSCDSADNPKIRGSIRIDQTL